MIKRAKRKIKLIRICPSQFENEKLRAELDEKEKYYEQMIDALAATESAELAQAYREGKIPRYAIGDTVYDRYGEPWQVVSAEVHSMRTKNEWLYRCGHEGTDDYCALWNFEAFPSREAALRREQDGY